MNLLLLHLLFFRCLRLSATREGHGIEMIPHWILSERTISQTPNVWPIYLHLLGLGVSVAKYTIY